MLGLTGAAGLGAAAGLKDKVLAGGAIVRVLFKLICTSNAAANGAIKAEPRRRGGGSWPRKQFARRAGAAAQEGRGRRWLGDVCGVGRFGAQRT